MKSEDLKRRFFRNYQVKFLMRVKVWADAKFNTLRWIIYTIQP